MPVKAALLELLATQGIGHPTRLRTVALDAGTLRLGLEGWRWWNGAGGDDGRVELCFTDIRSGCFDASLLTDRQDDEVLEDFHVSALADMPWVFAGTIHATYCQQPVPEPLAIYAAVHDFLVRTDAPCAAGDYLNQGQTLAGFCALAGQANFLIADAPGPVHTLVKAELDRQGVGHNVLTHVRPEATGLFVRWGNAGFICGDAYALWEEP